MLIRQNARKESAIREISFVPRVCRSSDGSCLVKMGHTQVMCAATVDKNIEGFQVEYGVLPSATFPKTPRGLVTGDHFDIGQTVARCLSIVFDQTVMHCGVSIDCDVLQSEGGVKAACISGAYIATALAIKNWNHLFDRSPILGQVIGVSAGLIRGEYIVDLDGQEMLDADASITFGITESGQVTALDLQCHRYALTLEQIHHLSKLALNSSKVICAIQRQILSASGVNLAA